MNKKAVVLLSGGIDSTTCLAQAVEEYGAQDVLALTLYYGQKHDREIKAASDIATHYVVTHIIQEIKGVFDFSDCTLLQGRGSIKHISYADQLRTAEAVDTYVPFRNGLFLAYAAAIAISVNAEVIYYGAHADDAAGRAYPDCTPEFEQAMCEAIFEGSGRQVTMNAPLIYFNKDQVVAHGLKLKALYHLTWSCYEGKDKPCGTCATCIDRMNAFKSNGVEDPAMN